MGSDLRVVCCGQVVGERSEPAAAKLHLWLERTAFYKVPKSHQDEVSEQCQKPFEQVSQQCCNIFTCSADASSFCCCSKIALMRFSRSQL